MKNHGASSASLSSVDLSANDSLVNAGLFNGKYWNGSSVGFKNELRYLNAKNCSKPEFLYVYGNDLLKRMNVQNGSNGNVNLRAEQCDSLECVIVDEHTRIPDAWIYES